MPASRLRGYLLIGSAACCWGASATLGRAMFTGRLWPAVLHLAPLDPLQLTQGRITLAALILLPILLRQRRGRVWLPRRELLRAMALGVLGMSASNYFYYLAIERTNVATAIVIQYTSPIWVLAYLVARGRQRASLARLGAVGLALTGIALVLGLGAGSALRLDWIGAGGALIAAFAFAYYNIGGQQLSSRTDPVLVSLAMLIGAALVWLVIVPPWRVWAAHYSGAQWSFLLLFSLLATLAPTLLYLAGLHHLDPTRAVVTSCLEPVSGILLASVFLGETLAWLQTLGVVCVIAAILLTAFEAAAAHRPAEELVEFPR